MPRRGKTTRYRLVRVAVKNKSTKIAPDFGSPSRRAKGSILFICDFWRNAEDGPKDKQDCGSIYFRGPQFARRIFARRVLRSIPRIWAA